METKDKLPGKVILDVEPITCSMSMTQDSGHEWPDKMLMHVRLVGDAEVRTPDNRKLNDARWFLQLDDGGSVSEFVEDHNAIGAMHYSAEYVSRFGDDDDPESCTGWVRLDTKIFTRVREMALTGRLPRVMRLHIKGIEYGSEPDGSGKVWNVEAHNTVAITMIDITTDFVKAPASVSFSEGPYAFPAEPSVPETPELVAMKALATAVEQVSARLGWVVGLLAVAVLIILFR